MLESGVSALKWWMRCINLIYLQWSDFFRYVEYICRSAFLWFQGFGFFFLSLLFQFLFTFNSELFLDSSFFFLFLFFLFSFLFENEFRNQIRSLLASWVSKLFVFPFHLLLFVQPGMYQWMKFRMMKHEKMMQKRTFSFANKIFSFSFSLETRVFSCSRNFCSRSFSLSFCILSLSFCFLALMAWDDDDKWERKATEKWVVPFLSLCQWQQFWWWAMEFESDLQEIY